MTSKEPLPTRQGTREPDERVERTDVVAKTAVATRDGPLEFHEHIEVKDRVEPGRPMRVEPVNERRELEHKQDARWLERNTTLRSRGFGMAALGIGLLTVVASLWFVSGVLRDETYIASWDNDAAIATLGVAMVVGFALAGGTGQGVVAALVMGWMASLGAMALAAYQAFTDFSSLSQTGQVLTVAMAIAGVIAFAFCTLGLASWRGRRAEERVYGYRGERRGAV